jgi:hypothetical protein
MTKFHKLSFMKNPLLSIISLLILLGAFEVRAQLGNDNPTGPAGVFNGYITTGGAYEPYTGNLARTIRDISVPGATGEYGLNFSRTWNSRSAEWTNSSGWWIENLQDWPFNQTVPYVIHFPDGRVITFTSSGGPGRSSRALFNRGQLSRLSLPNFAGWREN